MGKHNFDKHIKDKLEELDLNYDPTSWDTFEQKLDSALSQEEIDDAAFDKQVKEKIQSELNYSYEEEHWQELSQRIDYENELTNRIYIFKIAELVILVLLAYSFFQIEDIKDPKKNLPLMAHSEIFKSIEQKQIAKDLLATSIAQDNLKQVVELSSIASLRQDLKLIELDRAALATLEISDQKSELLLTDKLRLRDQISIESIDNNIATLSKVVDVELREHINLDPLTLDEDYIDMSSNIDLDKPEKWFSFSGSADVNLVNTPASFLFNGRPDQLLGATGLSSRLSYAIKSGKNEYEFGIGYAFKNYDPGLREVFNVDGGSLYAYSLNRIEFHIAQIPAFYKRYFVDNRNWAAYAAVGATHNFIMFSDYSLTDELLSGIWSPSDYRKANSDLLRRDYHTGLFQNVDQPSSRRSSSKEFKTEGNLFDNTFITSYAGVGVQRNFGTNRSIFLQTGYHHQFFGDKLGPNKDQINTFSFTLGGKFRI